MLCMFARVLLAVPLVNGGVGRTFCRCLLHIRGWFVSFVCFILSPHCVTEACVFRTVSSDADEGENVRMLC